MIFVLSVFTFLLVANVNANQKTEHSNPLLSAGEFSFGLSPDQNIDVRTKASADINIVLAEFTEVELRSLENTNAETLLRAITEGVGKILCAPHILRYPSGSSMTLRSGTSHSSGAESSMGNTEGETEAAAPAADDMQTGLLVELVYEAWVEREICVASIDFRIKYAFNPVRYECTSVGDCDGGAAHAGDLQPEAVTILIEGQGKYPFSEPYILGCRKFMNDERTVFVIMTAHESDDADTANAYERDSVDIAEGSQQEVPSQHAFRFTIYSCSMDKLHRVGLLRGEAKADAILKYLGDNGVIVHEQEFDFKVDNNDSAVLKTGSACILTGTNISSLTQKPSLSITFYASPNDEMRYDVGIWSFVYGYGQEADHDNEAHASSLAEPLMNRNSSAYSHQLNRDVNLPYGRSALLCGGIPSPIPNTLVYIYLTSVSQGQAEKIDNSHSPGAGEQDQSR